MNAVGIDVSKGKSTVAVLRPFGEVVASPFDVIHNDNDLKRLVKLIRSLPGESKQVYFLADHSKFDQISAITFAHLNGVQIITDRLPDQKYRSEATIREVL